MKKSIPIWLPVLLSPIASVGMVWAAFTDFTPLRGECKVNGTSKVYPASKHNPIIGDENWQYVNDNGFTIRIFLSASPYYECRPL